MRKPLQMLALLATGLGFSAITTVLVTGALVTSSGLVAACADDASTDDPDSGVCGPSTCTSTQICLYRECSTNDACVQASTCPTGWTPTVCGVSGVPGCLNPNCTPVLQGCRDIPESCGGDVTCACQSICGSAATCSNVNGRQATCSASD
ncbi:MAG: hypothetical protein FWD69_04785 [Polyangiaceae bacterium]|nr:hypothetical protein [Polyangiaceae bacterium]